MSGELPKVNPEVLLTATAAFDEAADALRRIQADLLVSEAAAAGQMLTVESCRSAQAGITAAVTAVVESARRYSESLDAAARAYLREDQVAGDDIGGVNIPS